MNNELTVEAVEKKLKKMNSDQLTVAMVERKLREEQGMAYIQPVKPLLYAILLMGLLNWGWLRKFFVGASVQIAITVGVIIGVLFLLNRFLDVRAMIDRARDKSNGITASIERKLASKGVTDANYDFKKAGKAVVDIAKDKVDDIKNKTQKKEDK